MIETSVIRPPKTLLEVYQSLPEGTMAQLIRNELIMSPAPLDIHQRVLSDLYLELGTHVKRQRLGTCRVAPYDVYLDEENVFQPDILYVSTARMDLIHEDGIHGAPDLVVEILSPSSARYDLGAKKAAYERFGVLEYWVVDPQTLQCSVFVQKQDKFELYSEETGLVRSVILGREFSFG